MELATDENRHVYLRVSAPTSTPRAGALLPDNLHVLNFAVAVDASADVPLLAWFDLGDEWLPKARQIHDQLARNMARVETLPRGSVLVAGRPGTGTSGAATGQADLRRPQLQGPRGRKQHGGAEVAGDLLEVRDLGHRRAQGRSDCRRRRRRWTTRPSWPSSSAAAPSMCRSARRGTTCWATEPERRERARPAVCRRAVAARQVVRHLRADRPGHRHARRRRRTRTSCESSCG